MVLREQMVVNVVAREKWPSCTTLVHILDMFGLSAADITTICSLIIFLSQPSAP